MKNYLSIYQSQQRHVTSEDSPDAAAALNDSRLSAVGEASKDLSTQQLAPADLGPSVDWNKVGRPYKASSGIDSVIENEMARLKIALDKRMVIQDVELEERAMIARGAKKK